MQSPYPRLTIKLDHLTENYQTIVQRCQSLGIAVSGVVKGSDSYQHSYKTIADCLLAAGCQNIADSRLNTIQRLRDAGFNGEILLLRLPMLSEVDDLVRLAEISLQSEIAVLNATNRAAARANKKHKVILMADLGDLREGFFDEEALINCARKVEDAYECLILHGIATNLGCYGAICPDQTNLSHLTSLAARIEKAIGRKLAVVSGGATTSLPLVYDRSIPAGINHLRIGEGALLARDLIDIWQLKMDDLHQDIYQLEAEIIEIKDKPSHPIGTIFIDAFGQRPTFQDIGWRKRALLAVGKRDFGSIDALVSVNQKIRLVGASSDHLIVDITDYPDKLAVGDVLTFHCYYQAMVYLTGSNSVSIHYQHALGHKEVER